MLMKTSVCREFGFGHGLSYIWERGSGVLFFSSAGEEERWESIGVPTSYLSFCLLLQLASLDQAGAANIYDFGFSN